MISRTKEFVKISNIIGSSQNPGVKGLPGLASVQPCGKGPIRVVADFLSDFLIPRDAGSLRGVKSRVPRGIAGPADEIASGLAPSQ
jgi:hypothetical protein